MKLFRGRTDVDRYLLFCSNPLRTKEQILLEYAQLQELPKVAHIGFYRPDIMIIGTTPVIITDVKTGVRHLVGEFIIFLVRRRVGRVWEVDFRFQNISNPIATPSNHDCTYMHPHILTKEHPYIEVPNGRLCIQKGQFGPYQDIRKGEIHKAVQKIIDILHLNGTGTPYHDIDNWPVWEGKND